METSCQKYLERLYTSYRDITGDAIAASNLALAHVMLDGRARSERQVEKSDDMVPLGEAAQILGISTKVLRKFVDRSKKKSQGQRVKGPGIQFFQAGKGSPLLFRRRWLEEFIEQNTPTQATDESQLEGRRSRHGLF